MSVLATRSAVPAVFSRPNAAPAPKHLRVSHNEKERLLRMARRKKLGPLDSVTDTGAMAAEPSEAVKQSGKYDVWSAKDEQEEEFKKVIVSETEQEFIRPIVVHPAIKVCVPVPFFSSSISTQAFPPSAPNPQANRKNDRARSNSATPPRYIL